MNFRYSEDNDVDMNSQYGDRICECCMEHPAEAGDFLCRYCSEKMSGIFDDGPEDSF